MPKLVLTVDFEKEVEFPKVLKELESKLNDNWEIERCDSVACSGQYFAIAQLVYILNKQP